VGKRRRKRQQQKEQRVVDLMAVRAVDFGKCSPRGLYCVRPAETIPCWAVQLAGCQSSMVGSTNKPPCDADGVRQPGDWLHPTEAETRTAHEMGNQNHAKGGADKLAEAMSIRLS
jgi:hypothetical protein